MAKHCGPSYFHVTLATSKALAEKKSIELNGAVPAALWKGPLGNHFTLKMKTVTTSETSAAPSPRNRIHKALLFYQVPLQYFEIYFSWIIFFMFHTRTHL
jgi:hypothetical protein